MIDIEIDLEYAALINGIEKLALATGKPFGLLCKQNARLIAVNLAIQTQPLGDDARAYAQGENAVVRDLYKVYVTTGKVFDQLKKVATKGKRTGEQLARAFIGAVTKGDLARAKKILDASGVYFSWMALGKFDGGTAHQQRRNNRGRIGRRETPSLIVTNPEKVKSYARKIARNVGIAKSGWSDPARALGGTRGIPQWVTRHKGHGAIVDDSSNDNNPFVKVTNNVPWVKQCLTDSQVGEAMRIQREKMLARLQYVLAYHARKCEGVQMAA